MAKLLDFGFDNIELWRSEEMQLVQVGAEPLRSAHPTHDTDPSRALCS